MSSDRPPTIVVARACVSVSERARELPLNIIIVTLTGMDYAGQGADQSDGDAAVPPDAVGREPHFIIVLRLVIVTTRDGPDATRGVLETRAKTTRTGQRRHSD